MEISKGQKCFKQTHTHTVGLEGPIKTAIQILTDTLQNSCCIHYRKFH